MSLALFFGTPEWGHTNPSLPLVAELIQRGDQILYYSLSVEQLGTIPKNFIVRRFVPQLDILQHASLFITHGGMNSTSEALYYGIPLLVIPQATDQHYVAKRVEQSGAGLRLDRKKVSSALLSHMATTILTNSHFAQGSKKIGASFRQAGGYMRAADEVQLFKQRYALI